MDIKNVIDVLVAQNAPDKKTFRRQLLEDMADSACRKLHCGAMNCKHCPFDSSHPELEERMGSMIEELY